MTLRGVRDAAAVQCIQGVEHHAGGARRRAGAVARRNSCRAEAMQLTGRCLATASVTVAGAGNQIGRLFGISTSAGCGGGTSVEQADFFDLERRVGLLV
jgi:hypothetical protein